MKRPGLWIALAIVGAFALGTVGALLVQRGSGTQVTGTGIPGDADNDGITDEFDYLPYDATR